MTRKIQTKRKPLKILKIMIKFIGSLFFGIIRKILYVAFFLLVLYVGVFGSETFHIKPFISNWVTRYVDNKTNEVKESVTSTITETIENTKIRQW